jgi:hypothetical protein
MKNPDTATQWRLREQFEREGYVGPIRAISEEAALELAAVILPTLKKDTFSPNARRNRHFDIPQVHDIAINPTIVDVLTEIYSREICLWRSHVFTGKPGRGLGWHSDYFRTLLNDPLDHLTLHFAVTEAPANNCLMLLPGSHKWSPEKRAAKGFRLIEKTLDGGYGTPYYVREGGSRDFVTMTLRPGEFFVFHPGLMHASVDRVGDNSNQNAMLGAVKAFAKKVEGKLNVFGVVEDPSRLAIGFRYCSPRNAISPSAYSETLGSGHCTVYLAGEAPQQGFADWRGQVAEARSKVGG